MTPGPDTRSYSVVIAAYTEERWDSLLSAIDSASRQTLQPREIVAVIDHNPELLARLSQQCRTPGVVITENAGPRGLSGARNSGVALARGSVIAFLDDDATADVNWLEQLDRAYANPAVIGAGGWVEPIWLEGRPAWFPREFDWVVGCSYSGLPQSGAAVRNLLGCNMSFRREVFDLAGRFRSEIGRVGKTPLGCEETELCIRALALWPDCKLMHEPSARVFHRVPGARGTSSYFRARCYAEGLSKARVAAMVGSKAGLASERAHVGSVLPQAFMAALVDAALGRKPGGLGRAGALVMGLACAAAGYAAGWVTGLQSSATPTEIGCRGADVVVAAAAPR